MLNSSFRRALSWRQLIFYGVWIGCIIAIVFAWGQASWQLLNTNLGDATLAISRLLGLLGAFGLVWQLLLVSRAGWLEQIHGFDVWTRVHRVNGVAAFVLTSAHIPLAVSGNAYLSGQAYLEQWATLITDWEFIGLAALGYVLLVGVIGASVNVVRRRLRYEVWYYLHLTNYVMLGLVLWHQIEHGLTLSQTWFVSAWLTLHVGIVTHLLMSRFGWPVWLFWRHRFYVRKVVAESRGVYSIYVGGRNLSEYTYRAGQFAKWRFLQSGLWSQEHPFTLSIAPNAEALRLTFKQVGDYTDRLPQVHPGTPVLLSQPLGQFTLHQADRKQLLLIGGGIGITPFRALLEAASNKYDITCVYAVRTADDLALHQELNRLLGQFPNRRLRIITSKQQHPDYAHGYIDAAWLREHVPDAVEREVFICGPPPMLDAVTDALQAVGVADKNIHTERFSL